MEALFSSPREIAAQCVGFLAMAVALFIYTFRSRKKILLSKLAADLLWVVHYALLGAFSGAGINLVNAFREGVFYHRDRKWASSRLWLLLFVLVNVLLTALTWQGAISLLPMLGSSVNTLALFCKKTRHIRLLSVPALSAWLIYSVLTRSIASTAVNAISVLSALYALWRDRTPKTAPPSAGLEKGEPEL